MAPGWRPCLMASMASALTAVVCLYGFETQTLMNGSQLSGEAADLLNKKVDRSLELLMRQSEELRRMKDAQDALLAKVGAKQSELPAARPPSLPGPSAVFSPERALPRLPEEQPAPAAKDSEFDKPCSIPPGMRKVTARPARGAPFPMVVLGAGQDIVSDQVAQTGGWEIRDPNDFAREARTKMPPDASLLDIGANLGYYTFLFANLGHRVVAVEAMTRNRAAIKATLCFNPSFRKLVTLVPTALANPEQVQGSTCVVRSTNSRMNIGNGALKCGSNVKPCQPEERGNCEEVPLKTLDTVLAEVAPEKISVVKMDVEAFECNVLAGGQTLFTQYQPHILQIETEFCCKAKDNCVQKAAEEHGYCKIGLGQNTALRKESEPGYAGRKCP
eukprot:TRINITY_DN90324_c0_g1_i1.p1 TRINITY_DN90324_c0_g1~~TRINITY_DN90324_c0_g1_i1.p1  ORF type:complete len:388 (+),score=88.00 TRINITY_DN90324_c0_g1_i1:99-1262(+)